MTELTGMESLLSRLELAFNELGIDMFSEDEEYLEEAVPALIGRRFYLIYSEPHSKELLFFTGVITFAELDGRHLRLTASHHQHTSISFIMRDDGKWDISDGGTRIRSGCPGKIELLRDIE